MNRFTYFFLIRVTLFVWLIQTNTHAQNVGINATGAAPHASAMLDILSSNKGLLIPRVYLNGTGDASTISSPAVSLMVYNMAPAGLAPTNVLPGFYYWDGIKWVAFGGTGGRNWSLLGNAGTVSSTHFLGTTDTLSLNFKVNNVQSGFINSSPSGVTFLGYQTSGNGDKELDNTVLGAQALYGNGYGNVAIGHSAAKGSPSTGGGVDVAAGYQALQNSIFRSGNVAIGAHALENLNFANAMIGIGWNAMLACQSGTDNVAFGSQASFNLNGASFNTAIGAQANYSRVTGDYNTAIGYQALYSTIAGNGTYNVAIGNQALFSATTGSFNTANGSNALYANTTGNGNTGEGAEALYFNQTGNENTAAGYRAAYGASGFSHSNNTVFGFQAGFALRTGSNNIFLGYQAGDAVTTGSNNIVIGYDIDAPSPTGNNQLTIGNLIFGNGLGATGTTVSTGSVGIGVSNPTYRLHVNGTSASTSFVATSDARKKKDKKPLALNSLAIINQLKPVTFEWQDVLDEGMKGTQIGFIAQDLEKVLPTMVLTGSDINQSKVVKYNELLPIFVKDLQEKQMQIEQLSGAQKKENEVLKYEHDLLKNELDSLEKQQEEILNALHKTKQN